MHRDNWRMLIFVLDHYPIMSEMITMMISKVQPGSKIIVAHTFKQLNSLIRKHKNPAFVFIEPKSTGCLGALSVAYISEILPNAKIILITDFMPNENSDIYFENGTHLIIEKISGAKKIIAELREIFKEKNEFTELNTNYKAILKITKRLHQLIHLLDLGLSNQEIALQMGIKPNSVKTHLHRLYKILNVNNRLQALNFARKNGWVNGANLTFLL